MSSSPFAFRTTSPSLLSALVCPTPWPIFSPATITDASGATKSYGLAELDDELFSMALICTLPDTERSFRSALMLKETLDRTTIIQAFANE